MEKPIVKGRQPANTKKSLLFDKPVTCVPRDISKCLFVHHLALPIYAEGVVTVALIWFVPRAT